MKFNSWPDRALEVVSGLGGGLKGAMPGAVKWLDTGAKLGALKAGTRVAGVFIKRNPVIAVATVAGAGLLWYAARRQAQRAQDGEPIEGTARRVNARRPAAGARKSGARRRTARSATS